jgi:hypothetical protein
MDRFKQCAVCGCVKPLDVFAFTDRTHSLRGDVCRQCILHRRKKEQDQKRRQDTIRETFDASFTGGTPSKYCQEWSPNAHDDFETAMSGLFIKYDVGISLINWDLFCEDAFLKLKRVFKVEANV